MFIIFSYDSIKIKINVILHDIKSLSLIFAFKDKYKNMFIMLIECTFIDEKFSKAKGYVIVK